VWKLNGKSGVLKEIQMEKCNKNKYQQQKHHIMEIFTIFSHFPFVVVCE
jgi:hypothetical protein